MAGTPSTFRRLDGALKAAAAAGLEVQRVEIDHAGKIVLIFCDDDAKETSEPTALVSWRANRGAS
jgi:hypothetical protein